MTACAPPLPTIIATYCLPFAGFGNWAACATTPATSAKTSGLKPRPYSSPGLFERGVPVDDDRERILVLFAIVAGPGEQEKTLAIAGSGADCAG